MDVKEKTSPLQILILKYHKMILTHSLSQDIKLREVLALLKDNRDNIDAINL